MSSGLLYLAIVGVWAGVLVPMWVRRSDAGEARSSQPTDEVMMPRGYGKNRARIVARRRRRLAGIVLLFLVTVVIAATGIAPWWIVPVPGVTLVGYLACLRAAASYDAELRQRDLARAEATGRVAAEAAETADAPALGQSDEDLDVAERDTAAWQDPRVIDFQERVSARGRDEPFDQYADPPARAVGS